MKVSREGNEIVIRFVPGALTLSKTEKTYTRNMESAKVKFQGQDHVLSVRFYIKNANNDLQDLGE